jgi:hypothetical protein
MVNCYRCKKPLNFSHSCRHLCKKGSQCLYGPYRCHYIHLENNEYNDMFTVLYSEDPSYNPHYDDYSQDVENKGFIKSTNNKTLELVNITFDKQLDRKLLNEGVNLKELLRNQEDCINLNGEFLNILRDEDSVNFIRTIDILLLPENSIKGCPVDKIEELLNQNVTNIDIFDPLIQNQKSMLVSSKSLKSIYDDKHYFNHVNWDYIQTFSKKYAILPDVPKINIIMLQFSKIHAIKSFGYKPNTPDYEVFLKYKQIVSSK